MGLNDTPSANRIHIGFFGLRNAGKSSLVNAVTGQEAALVSEIKGTTTDPVLKAMELLPLGPVLIIDTPGIDDEGALGEQRVRRARKMLNKTDMAVFVADASIAPNGILSPVEQEFVNLFKEKNIPYIIVWNKADVVKIENKEEGDSPRSLSLSAKTGFNIDLLKEKIAALAAADEAKTPLVGGLVKPLDFVLLVIPIDKAAPKGRLILPQQQTIRGILEAGAVAVTVRDFELKEVLEKMKKKPDLVITDSQAFAKVSAEVPRDIPLTSFSILFARYKGFLETSIRAVTALEALQDGDKILVCEGCSHHRQCDDIGTVKIPRWIRSHTKKEPGFDFFSGSDFPEDLSSYKLVIHCGGCMLNDREMQYRSRCAEDQKIPFTNYGITIAYIEGILDRSVQAMQKAAD